MSEVSVMNDEFHEWLDKCLCNGLESQMENITMQINHTMREHLICF